jgi:Methane oxygenase PmoA
MGERTLTRLRLNGMPVADYVDGSELDPILSPQPYLHPVRTLGGTVVTDALPGDHRWHLGICVALQDVAGWNFWGGRTYMRGRGYVWREDHGRIEHAGFAQLGDDGFTEKLHWLNPQGELLLTEHRRVQARLADRGWELELITTLTNAAGRPIRLGSPATNGREGAGYGGLFWRLPPAREPRVYTATAAGEHAVHDCIAQWLAWADHAAGVTLVFTGTDDTTRADPWFVRVKDYPGIGSQLAARDPLILPAGGAVTRGLRTLLADGALGNDAIQAWADATAPDPRPGHAATGPHNPASQAHTLTGTAPPAEGSAPTGWRG